MKRSSSEALEDLRKQIFQENRELDDRISGEEMKLLERNRIWKVMLRERRNANMEEGREKFSGKGDVTRMAVSGSRTSEIKAEFLVAEGMIEDLRKTHLLLGVGALGRQWWFLPETEHGRGSLSEPGRQRSGGNNLCWRWSKFRDEG